MLHGGGVAVHAPGEGWAKRAGKMPHGRVTSRFLSREKPSRRMAVGQEDRQDQAMISHCLLHCGKDTKGPQGYSSGRKKWKEASMAASRQSWIRTTSQQVLRKAARRPQARPHRVRASSRT